MKFKKKTIKESLNIKKTEIETYSKKPQNIIMSEGQFERLIGNLTK
jgi:hypothetical protein